MREDDIRTAIENLSGDKFERFARELLRCELYPGLNPTSASHDLGEDAHTETTTLFMHNGLWVSVAISKTATLVKVKEDCNRCKETGRQIDVLVFATAGDPRTDIEDQWRKEVQTEFGWSLEVRALRWLAPVAGNPKYESLVDDYLQIPPPGGDYVQTLIRQFSHQSQRLINQARLKIPGVANSLPRSEVDSIQDQLNRGKRVVLTGEAGTGKSGIGINLALAAINVGRIALFLDARNLSNINNELELRQYLGLNGPVLDAMIRIGRYQGCRLIIDQLDNAVGTRVSTLLIELALDCSAHEGVEIVVISRKREAHEVRLLEKLLAKDFVEMTSYPVSEEQVRAVLNELGIPQTSTDFIDLGRNLLNLELIGMIKQQKPSFDFSGLLSEVDLWENYRQVLVEREAAASDFDRAEIILAEAIKLAHIGLRSEDRSFKLDYPFSHPHQRLISWEVIVIEEGRNCRFRHEKLQDFLYAWDATEQNMMPLQVLAEIGPHRSRNILLWMSGLYTRRSSPLNAKFLKEMLNA